MANQDEYLSFFKHDVLERAFQYYESDYVHELKRLSSDVITASVEGTDSKPYAVRIDLSRPYHSECSCPYAAQGKMCKHMAAVFFAAFPEQAKAYEDYAEGKYLGEDDFDIEQDEHDFLPANYSDLLEEFLNQMDGHEKEELLRKLLNRDPMNTYSVYLRGLYEQSMENSSLRRAEEIHRLLTLKTPYYAGSTADFTKPVLSEDIRQELDNSNDETLINEMVKQFKDVRLYSFSDAVWLAEYLSCYDTETGKNRFANELEDHTAFMEEEVHTSGYHPLNNVLKALYVLRKEWTPEDLAYDLLKHLKYTGYAAYVLETEKDIPLLYYSFRDMMHKSIFNRRAVHQVLHLFAERLDDPGIHELADYYDYVYNFNRVAFDRLKVCPDFREVVLPRLLQQKPHIVKETMAQLQMSSELFALLKKENDIWGMVAHAPLLDTSHHEQLVGIFRGEFMKHIEKAENRREYENACQYIRALCTLQNGDEIVEEIVRNLKKQDRYAKRRALFEEIEKVRS
ncbi:MAG: hypothetical protein E7185_06050 [Erysipelotrichaceae bacterium]|nr:hypothetical protein [Erysipelotrichaceae bacterium]